MVGPWDWGRLRTLGGPSVPELVEDTHLALLFVMRVGVRIMNGLQGSSHVLDPMSFGDHY